MLQMTILAFMQNPWFPPNTAKRHVELYNTDQEFHRRLLAGTMSGRRLRQAFGDLFGKIHWDNVAPAAAEEASGVTDVDMKHVERVIGEVKPQLILTFGTLAKGALENSIRAYKIKRMDCHHPNARGRTQGDLDQFASDVQSYITSVERKQ